MPIGRRPTSGGRFLDLGGGALRGGGRGMEFLLAGALGLIIIGSLGLTLYSLFGEPGAAGGTGRELPRFQCQKCGHEFAMPSEKVYEMVPETELSRYGIARLDCPKCGARKSALEMTKCPKCGKYYLSEGMKARGDAFTQREPKAGEQAHREVCPHCGTDRDK